MLVTIILNKRYQLANALKSLNLFRDSKLYYSVKFDNSEIIKKTE